MKQFEVKALGLEELSAQDQINTIGGSGLIAGLIVAVILIAAAAIAELTPGGVELDDYQEVDLPPIPGS